MRECPASALSCLLFSMSPCLIQRYKILPGLGELKNEGKTDGGALVYIKLRLRSSLCSLRKHRKNLSGVQYLSTDAESNINSYRTTHTQHFSPPGYKNLQVNARSPGLERGPLDECVSWADLGAVPTLVLSLSAPHCPGPSPVCQEWQWAQLFLSSVMHFQADL